MIASLAIFERFLPSHLSDVSPDDSSPSVSIVSSLSKRLATGGLTGPSAFFAGLTALATHLARPSSSTNSAGPCEVTRSRSGLTLLLAGSRMNSPSPSCIDAKGADDRTRGADDQTQEPQRGSARNSGPRPTGTAGWVGADGPRAITGRPRPPETTLRNLNTALQHSATLSRSEPACVIRCCNDDGSPRASAATCKAKWVAR